MVYHINKIVGFIASPIGFAIAAGIAAIVFAKFKQVRTAKWIGIATVAWLWFWMTPFAARFVGAPAWADLTEEQGIYLKGFRDGSDEQRVKLLKDALMQFVG